MDKDFLIKLLYRFAKETDNIEKIKEYKNKRAFQTYLYLRRKNANSQTHLHMLDKLYKNIRLIIIQDIILLPHHEYYKELKSILKDKTDEYIRKACELYVESKSTLTSILKEHTYKNNIATDKFYFFNYLGYIENITIHDVLMRL